MEVNWNQRQIEGYLYEGSLVFQQIVAGDGNPELVDHGLNLLRTYLHIRKHLPNDSRLAEVMVRLTWALHEQVHDQGYWDSIYAIWQEMQAIARKIPDPAQYAEVTKQLAITKNARGEAKNAQLLYEELITSPQFSQFTLEQQADILHQTGVCYAEQGKTGEALQVLHRCLTIPIPTDDATNIRHKTASITAKLQKSRCAGAMVWESKAFAYNQLGHTALLQRELVTARRYYEASLEIFLLHNEEENLACVAYQALGRLLLSECQFAEAEGWLQKNLMIRRRRGERAGSAYAAAYLAESYLGAGKVDNAETLLNEAMSTFTVLSDQRGMALCHYDFGRLEDRRSNQTAAINQWQQAQKIAATIPIPALEVQTLVALLYSYLNAGPLYSLWATLLRLLYNLHQQKLGPIAAWRLLVQYRA